MKTIERQTEGYNEQCLEDFCRSVLFHSWSRNKTVPVRGVCFAAGIESTKLARDFAGKHLGLGIIGFQMSAMTVEAWHGITAMLIQHRAEVSSIGFLLHALDLTVPGLEQEIANVVDATESVDWIATAGDPTMLHPRLRLPFLVYLGVGKSGRMRYLIQDGQQLLIDKGSLKKAAE